MKFKYLTNDTKGKFKKSETCFIVGMVYTNTGTIIHTVNENTGMICSCVADDLQLADHGVVTDAPAESPAIFTVEDAEKMKNLFGGEKPAEPTKTIDGDAIIPTKTKRSHHAKRGKK